MSQGLIRRLTVLSQYEEALVKINATAAERLTALKAKPQASIQRDMLSICNDPFTVAQQLTHIELVRAVLLDLWFFISFESRTMAIALLKSVIGPHLAQRANFHRSYLWKSVKIITSHQSFVVTCQTKLRCKYYPPKNNQTFWPTGILAHEPKKTCLWERGELTHMMD